MDKLNVLLSYYHVESFFRTHNQEVKSYFNEDYINLLLDSGAYTAFTQNIVINIDNYMSFISKYKIKDYIVLDVIGNSEKTYENYLIMKKSGFNPIPVFTYGESLEKAKDRYDKESWLCIGAINSKYKKKVLIKAYEVIKHFTKVHTLGLSINKYLYSLKPYSTDSSSWNQGVMYGYFTIYSKGKLLQIDRNDIIRKPNLEVLNLLSLIDIDINVLKKTKSWHRQNHKCIIQEIATRSWLLYANDLYKKGINYYFASARYKDIIFLKDNYNYMKTKDLI